jgi:hypothetical protein
MRRRRSNDRLSGGCTVTEVMELRDEVMVPR